MTYNEAIKFINEHWGELQPQLIASKPAHLIEKTIIAPEKTPLNTLVVILSYMEEGNLPNDAILSQMNLMGENLIVYVVFKRQGYTIILPFDVYKSIAWVIEDGSGNLS